MIVTLYYYKFIKLQLMDFFKQTITTAIYKIIINNKLSMIILFYFIPNFFIRPSRTALISLDTLNL
ncbi:hypothetical protein BJQ96_01192 [Flavobacterium sp. PL0002]|nr:hypothetical protein [Flavobacterium sp. PL002]